MGFQDAVSNCLRNYASFSGRASRSEFWFFFLFSILIQIVISVLGVVLPDVLVGLLGIAVSLALLLPSLAVTVRRLHDVGRSGWWMLIALVPLLGIVLLLVWYCTRGEPQPNRFGPNPLAASVLGTMQPAG
ncbi:DUF805 domain-containing protein [Siccirubricoccus sp. KC 17139]|uniref:DUF805 domain-containing protein n=1 Tax=Siccirubricoccus soli TaxID=2899147 RepID=A0ABT1DCT8_9PROT|nr:DUF805 domain-containing protein [Siccirubricoccus soli]MCO6419748.1 DUF805 domain-containing protein [Siccirubricoccus soli]MCP2685883.1 DUF805 domain-containing protein [Siccirubricoccus soli]